MRGFAILLLCVVAAVQGRSTGANVNERAVAVRGENPWVVHLRLAIATSGFLETCVGAVIDNNWVLTTAFCVRDSRFVWMRYGAVNVIEPVLVLESTNVRLHEDYDFATGENNIALVGTTRFVETNENIAVIALPAADSEVADAANYCAYGQIDEDTPGESLSCWDVTTVEVGDYAVTVEGEDISASKFDIGAPLVSEETLVGLLTKASESSEDQADFIRISAYVNWIVGMTGIEQRDAVIFVN